MFLKNSKDQTANENDNLISGAADAAGSAGPNPVGPAIFDVDTEGFEAAVMQASMETPVIVDFWAPWCGPCKQLMPVLEKVIAAAGGKVKLAKVNIDDNQQLAQALRVQSVPTIMAFYKGQPVTGFAGAQPESEITKLVQQLIQMAAKDAPDSIDIPEVLKLAAQALAINDLGQAQGLYMQILQQDENNAPAYAGLMRTFINGGAPEQAREMMNNASAAIKTHADYKAVETALELSEALPADTDVVGMEAALEKNADNHQERFNLAEALFAAGDKERAIDEMIEIIRRDREWEDEKARHQLLKYFEAVGPADPLSIAGRKKLSRILFS